MPLNKEALLRYKIINRLLLNKRKPYPTMQDIQKEMEKRLGKPFAVSTVQKDIKAMKEDEQLGFFAPISFSRKHQGYYYKDPEYSIDDLPIKDEELEALNTALSFMRSIGETSLGKNYIKALEKIYKYVTFNKKLGPYAQSFIIPETNAKPDNIEIFDRIIKAIQKKYPVALLHFSYQHKASSEHIVHPYLLKEYKGIWYLIGYSEKHREVRTFGLDRILRLKTLSQRYFHQSKKFDPGEYFRHCVGITRNKNNQREKIHLRFQAELEPYILSKPIHPSQQVVPNTHPLEIMLDVYITLELESLLMSFGDQVSILSPEWLADRIRQKHLLAAQNMMIENL